MPDLSFVHDRKFAVILIEDDGSEDGAWTVLSGVAKWREGHLFVHRGLDVPEFPIPDHTLDRVKPVPPDLREMLEEASFFTMLSVGPFPEGADPSEFPFAGLRLPVDGNSSGPTD